MLATRPTPAQSVQALSVWREATELELLKTDTRVPVAFGGPGRSFVDSQGNQRAENPKLAANAIGENSCTSREALTAAACTVLVQ